MIPTSACSALGWTNLGISGAFHMSYPLDLSLSLSLWNNNCQFPINWDLPRFPRPLKNNCDNSYIRQFFQYPTSLYILICIQLEQQILHKIGVSWGFIVTTVMVFQLKNPAVLGPSSVLKKEVLCMHPDLWDDHPQVTDQCCLWSSFI